MGFYQLLVSLGLEKTESHLKNENGLGRGLVYQQKQSLLGKWDVAALQDTSHKRDFGSIL